MDWYFDDRETKVYTVREYWRYLCLANSTIDALKATGNQLSPREELDIRFYRAQQLEEKGIQNWDHHNDHSFITSAVSSYGLKVERHTATDYQELVRNTNADQRFILYLTRSVRPKNFRHPHTIHLAREVTSSFRSGVLGNDGRIYSEPRINLALETNLDHFRQFGMDFNIWRIFRPGSSPT